MTAVSEALDPLIRGLLRQEAYDHPTGKFEVLETHISWVILTGAFAYKLKKPVDYGFVDFTTLDKRRFYCEEELRLNRRLTQDLYLAVRPIYGPQDRATFCGTGEPIDYAVQMRQFSQAELLPNVLARGDLAPELLDRLAKRIAEFQQQAPTATSLDQFGSKETIRELMDANLVALDHGPHHRRTVDSLRTWASDEFTRCESEWMQRRIAGKVCEGHGDLHLGNMILRHHEIEVFDCLEFNPGLRWSDVISEVAFLVMDLADRGRPDLGWRFLNEWLTQTGDYDGMKIWAWYFAYRALVRAKVALLRRQQADVTEAEARHLDCELGEYLGLAASIAHRPPPKLILTHGVSGSGKSYWAQRIASECGMVWIRSDIERKRCFAPQVEAAALYSPETTAKTYQVLRDLAQSILSHRWSVIVDATFLAKSQREPFRRLANDLGIACQLLSFRADGATLRQRIRERQHSGRDPSDATVDVLLGQLDSAEPIDADEGWNVEEIDTRDEHVAHCLLTILSLPRTSR